MTKQQIKPFLRWAGGKSWLVKHLPDLLPCKGFGDYFEPFLGGGAIFLALDPPYTSFLSDLNEELIETYKVIKDDPENLIRVLKTFRNTKEDYYHIRETEYEDAISRAARFVYLNQTSYNGIYRVNMEGIYNVPYGFRTKNFLEEDKIYNTSKKLQNAELVTGDFDDLRGKIKEGDLVFLDPPYTVSHNNNGFIKYNQKLFSLEDQYRLSNFVDYIKMQGAFYILTNAAHHKILEIFDKGDTVISLSRANLIGGRNAQRGQIKEYVFTNIENEV